MTGKNNLLLKTFSVSLFIHIAGISMFSIVLPARRDTHRPIEVSLLPPSASPEPAVELAATEPLPEMPRIIKTDERIAIYAESDPVRLSSEHFIGFPQHVPVTQVAREFEIPEFQLKLPDIISFPRLEKSVAARQMDVEITGPAGERGLIYRKETEYPDWARAKSIQGNVRIKFWVAPDGRITLTEIAGPSGYPELDIHAEQSLRQWLFEPARTDREAWGIITFRFRLK